jgi:hypothetical protein
VSEVLAPVGAVVVVLLVAAVELAAQLFAASGAVVGFVQVLAGAVVSAQGVLVAAAVFGLAAVPLDVHATQDRSTCRQRLLPRTGPWWRM